MPLSQELQDLLGQVGQTQSADKQLSNVFNKYGEYTSGFSQAYTGYNTAAQSKQIATPTKGTNLFSTLGDVAKTSVNLFEKAAGYVVNTPKYIFEGVKPYLGGIAKTVTGTADSNIKSIENQRVQLDSQLQKYAEAYKSGKMSKANYSKALQEYSIANSDLNKAAIQEEQTLNQQTRDAMIGAANTAATILLGGRLKIANAEKVATAKAATIVGSQEVKQQAIQKIVDASASKLEKVVTNIPAVRDLVVRNLDYLGRREAQQLAGESTAQYLIRESKAIAVNMLLKRPILYETNIQGAQDIYDKMITGKYGDAAKQSAWLGTQMLSGGPLGAVAKGLSWLKKGTRDLAYGQGSFIDELSKSIGNKKYDQIANYLQDLKTKDPAKFKDAEKTLRILQEVNLKMASEDVKQAANRVLDHWDQYSINLSEVTPEKVIDLFKNWSDAHELKNFLIKTGKLPGIDKADAGKYVVVRWDTDAKNALIKTLQDGGDSIQNIVDNYTAWRIAPGNGAGQNAILTAKIESLINETMAKDGGGIKKLADEIRGLSAASVMTDIPKKYQNQFEKLGFAIAKPSVKKGTLVTPAIEYKDTRKLITALQSGNRDVFDVTTQPQPQLAFFAKMLEKAGVSPADSTSTANRELSQNVVASLSALNEAHALGFSTKDNPWANESGQVILSRLKKYVDELQPSVIGNMAVGNRATGPAITDIRQLSIPEIERALGVGTSEAKAVSRAVADAYAQVPMELRGLGDRVVDKLYQINPAQKHYSRLQSALRYTYNPFFRVQESVETSILARAQARTILWNKSKQELDKSVGILDSAGIFKTGLSGEAAQDMVLGRITANLTPGQKRNMAGLAETIAKQRNMTLEQLIEKHPEDITDALRVVVQYPNKGILNTSLARTLNIAFFPMRYNAKITVLSAKILSKEAPSVQLAVINSLFNLKDWLKSDEGIQWQSQNSEAIQVLNWLTPINSLEYGLQKLTHRPNSIGELGSLGGLPLGFISQMLDSQGIIDLNTPYVNPKTGDVIPKYIPESTRARGATALADLINSVFTYPGRTLGLPGKNQLIKAAVKNFIYTQPNDFTQQIDESKLTPLQKRWVEVLKGNTSSDAIDALYNSPAPGQFNWYTLPPLDLPMKAAPLLKTAQSKVLEKAPKGKRAKNLAQPIQGGL